MAETTTSPIIGVDAGGTACRFAMVHDGRRVEHSARGANVSTDFDAAIEVLTTGLSALASKAAISLNALEPARAFLGLAGVTDAEMGARVAEALPIRRAEVTDDTAPAVAGALGCGDGAVVGIGTGSFVARRTGGTLRRVGGWGLTLGDEASGAWLGRSALSWTLHAVDGLEPHSELTRTILADHGEVPARIIRFAADAGPETFAEMAPRIVTAAQDGDPAALALMRQGAAYIDAALAVLGWEEGEALCLTGGLAKSYTPYLSAKVADHATSPAATALDGALQLAEKAGH